MGADRNFPDEGWEGEGEDEVLDMGAGTVYWEENVRRTRGLRRFSFGSKIGVYVGNDRLRNLFVYFNDTAKFLRQHPEREDVAYVLAERREAARL